MTNLDYASDEIDAGAHLIPPYMIDGVKRYVLHGIPPGDFLRALLCNDFMEAAGRADDYNFAALGQWARFLYNHVPGECRGSPEHYTAWLGQGGLLQETKP